MSEIKIVELAGRKVVKVGGLWCGLSLMVAAGYKIPRRYLGRWRTRTGTFRDVPGGDSAVHCEPTREHEIALGEVGFSDWADVPPIAACRPRSTSLLRTADVADIAANTFSNIGRVARWWMRVADELSPSPPAKKTPPPPPPKKNQPHPAIDRPIWESLEWATTPSSVIAALDWSFLEDAEHAPEGYPVDFERLWRALGYKHKQHAKEALEASRTVGVDFCLRISVSKPGSGGHNRQDIWLTRRAAKHFAMSRCGKRLPAAEAIRDFYIRLEESARPAGDPDTRAILATLANTLDVVGRALAPLNAQIHNNTQEIQAIRQATDNQAAVGAEVERIKQRQDAQEDLLRRREESERGQKLFPLTGGAAARAARAFSSSNRGHEKLMRVCARYLGIVARHVDDPDKGAWLEPFTMELGDKSHYKDVDVMRYNEWGAAKIKEFLDGIFNGDIDPGLRVEELKGGGRKIGFPRDVSTRQWSVWRCAVAEVGATFH